ncbi:hypothetical protein K1T71_011345 [Dendrolimus kikuchii]|uniref:Uncharacterized protein n=1 Tax=Dendrolimus kikuchii TaxID=765133 RepID=A0ACC1CP36_9NEOP|nr:hypothetical protein K1T71_011345 [Dendrolimus kikuchii]
MVVAPIQWLTASFYFLFGPILKFTRLQSSKPIVQELFIHLVNKFRLVNVDTFEDIEKANVNGELWLRGPTVCMGYYKNEEETKISIVDGWLRSGDIFYTDEKGHFYFVERLKLLLKYRSYQISPTEVENVIRQHPGVLDVAVTGIHDQECGDLVVACVVPKPGYKVYAQEIKDLVKENLSEAKQLRGGVIFMNELPMTSTTKTNRRLLNQIVLGMTRE